MNDSLGHSYEQQASSLTGVIPALDAGRLKALEAFKTIGIPGKKHENWRYADLANLRSNVYPLASHSKGTAPTIEGDFAATYVYVNGGLDEEQSMSGDAMQAVRVSHLSNHLASNEARADSLLSEGDGLILLNTALMREGFVFQVPAGVKVEKPILVHHVINDADSAALHLRHAIELGEGAEATIIECFSGDNCAYWLNNILEIRLSESASLTHLRLFTDGKKATHTDKCYIDLDANANYSAFSVATGGRMMRGESHVRILGEEARAQLDCIALAASGQIHDIVTHMDHTVPSANSDQMFRAVVAKQGKTAFQGKVVVRKDAQHTLADQACNSILLDRSAEANAKPELEIWADDVKCSHGATVGELDEKALFYLMARGIAPEDAKAILIEAFVAEVIERLENDTLKAIVTGNVDKWLESNLRA